MNQLKHTVVGLSLVILVITLMIGWRMHAKAARPRHMQEIAAELASVGKFLASIPLVPDNAGDRLLFGQSTEEGVGIFLLDIAGGQKRLVHEQSRKNYDPAKFRILGWSTDDRLFAYQAQAPQKFANAHINICDGKTGKLVNSFAVDGKMINGKYVAGLMSGFAWLSPHIYAYVRIIGGERDLIAVEEKADGTWVPHPPCKNISKNPTSMLTATSSHSVVWQEGNNLQSLDVVSGVREQLFKGTNTVLKNFSFAPGTGKYLLLCWDAAGQSLSGFQPDDKQADGWVQAGSFTDLGRISSQPDAVEKALWINHDRGTAYLVPDLGQKTLLIKTNVAAAAVSLLGRGSVINFAVSHDQVFASGSLTNEPPGIWQCDPASGALNRVYGSEENHFKCTKYVAPTGGAVTNAAGRVITYHLWEPVRSASAKKSPLLIGQSPFNWQVYPEMTANGGDFFVNVDRPSFLCKELGNWAEDVMTVYVALADDPRIDTNAVYLYGTSAESAYLAELVDQKPGLWRGIILITPENFPAISNLHGAKVLIDDGMDDASTMELVTKYQQAAAEAGMPVALALHKDAGHIYWSNATMREEAQQLARFLFGY